MNPKKVLKKKMSKVKTLTKLKKRLEKQLWSLENEGGEIPADAKFGKEYQDGHIMGYKNAIRTIEIEIEEIVK